MKQIKALTSSFLYLRILSKVGLLLPPYYSISVIQVTNLSHIDCSNSSYLGLLKRLIQWMKKI